ncbi:MAG: hypothetical protein DCC68_11460 [Planctomycetota bacterium]|nr:MAG: hypothetical protein DCC68_11460 [Planctomycetota bacterium]
MTQPLAFAMPGNAVGIGADPRGPRLVVGADVPADGQAGYPRGGLFLRDRNAAASEVYVNTGTAESCAFAPATFIAAMTETARDALTSPPAGLVIYNTTTNKLNVRAASAWEAVTSS